MTTDHARAKQEQKAMRLAIEFSWKASGLSAPNPAVGCVILDAHGTIVGKGHTSKAGGPHAEINALVDAGTKARGCTAVVTLEPCNHFGRTPPCVDALIKAGIKRVVYAVSDPNPKAKDGAIRLRAAGIEVEEGLLANEACKGPLEPWLHVMQHNRPFVTLKYAATFDGKIAAKDGSSQWVTNAASRADVQLWRSRCDAIMVGTNTALLDNPRLTLRKPDGSLESRQLLRVVAGKRDIPAHYNLHDDSAETLFIHERDPHKVLQQLHERRVQHVYLEGGHTLAAAFLQAGLVNRMFVYLAPKFLGEGTPAVGNLGITNIAGALRLHVTDVQTFQEDWQTDIRLTASPIFKNGQFG